MRTVLDFSSTHAREFFLKEESYCSFDLPSYFEFQDILDNVYDEIKDKKLSDFYGTYNRGEEEKERTAYPDRFKNVNLSFLNNKDGRFAWRPFQLIHPALYCSLCIEITKDENWDFIVSRFEDFQENPNIKCYSLPVESTEVGETDKAATVTNWWKSIEQRSIELALDYEYLFHTDISDCYGSIYTHSIPWALHGLQKAKEKRRDDSLVGNAVDNHIQDMSYGQTNGIPQGSALMDFIAEIVLGYADLKLSERLSDSRAEDYQIIRYRDDYRIFTNNPQIGNLILKCLTEVLIEINLELKPNKTRASSDVVSNSIKEDKMEWIISNSEHERLQKHLLVIHGFSKKHPNSGSLIRSLSSFYDRLRDESVSKNHNNIKVLISIIVDIAFKNPRAYPISAAILGELLSILDYKSEREDIIDSIEKKFDKIPNTGHLQVWLQRVTVKFDGDRDYSEILCKRVEDSSVKLWNSGWLEGSLYSVINKASIVNHNIIENMSSKIQPEEVKLFEAKKPY